MPDMMDIKDIAFPHLGIYLENISRCLLSCKWCFIMIK